LGLIGACLISHWLIERREAAVGKPWMRPRQFEALLLFIVVPILVIIGLWTWTGLRA
jgi:hypothetical protein